MISIKENKFSIYRYMVFLGEQYLKQFQTIDEANEYINTISLKA